jgi:hypothetical protein
MISKNKLPGRSIAHSPNDANAKPSYKGEADNQAPALHPDQPSAHDSFATPKKDNVSKSYKKFHGRKS